MKQTTCPFLGLKEDPDTSLNFPSQGNFCHHARPIEPISTNHQERFCLTWEFTGCSIYQAVQPAPVPEAIAVPAYRAENKRRRMPVFSLPVLAALVLTTGLVLSLMAARLGANAQLIPQTGNLAQASSFGLFNYQLTPTPSLTLSQSTALRPSVQRSNCKLPDGWTLYTVNPTDSLFRLSIIYGVTIETLQEANCMGSDTVILPGRILFVPILPTVTPSTIPTLIPTLTFSPTITPRPLLPALQSDTSANEPINAPPVPSATPRPPASVVPPTQPASTKANPQPTKEPPAVKLAEKPKDPQVKPTQKPNDVLEVKPTKAPKAGDKVKPTQKPKK